MPRTRYILLAIAAGLTLTGCGNQPQPTATTTATTKAPTPSTATAETGVDLVQLGQRCLAAQGDEDVCFEMVDTCLKAMDVHQRGCITGLKRCLSTVADQRRCFKSAASKPAKDEPKPTKQKKQKKHKQKKSLKACLEDIGLTATDSTSSSLTMKRDGNMVVAVTRQDSAAEAKRLVRAYAKADYEARDERAIGRYFVEYPDRIRNGVKYSDASDASHSERSMIRNCIKEGN